VSIFQLLRYKNCVHNLSFLTFCHCENFKICILQGKESIEMILEKLEAEGCSIMENYETFSRVSIRRLGRLLPDARWVGCQSCHII
jgi:hypothetical protein